MNRCVVRWAAIAELLLFVPCAGQPVGGMTNRGFLGVELRPIDAAAIEGEKGALERAKLSETEKATARKRAAALRPGVMIVGVRKQGPAERAGLKAEDIITAANGKPVITLSDLQRALRELRPGGSTEVTYLRIGADGSSGEGTAKVVSVSGDEINKLTGMERAATAGGFRVSQALPARMAEDFDDVPAGELPTEWVVGRTGDGTAAGWRIAASDGKERNVLQVVQPAGGVGNAVAKGQGTLHLCIFENAAVGGNMYMRLRMKAVGESKSQAGGIVWDYEDENNFYMALLDFGRGAVEAYKVVEGTATLLKSEPCTLRLNEWYEIRPEQANGRVQVWMGKPSKVVLRSERDLTFQAGRVGVVSKGDSEIVFDEISAQRTPAPGGV